MKLPLSLALLSVLSLQTLSAAPTGLDTQGQLAPLAFPARTEGFQFQALEQGVQFRVGGMTKNVLFYGPDIVRVSANLGATHTQVPSFSVIAKPEAPDFKILEQADRLVIQAARLHIEITKSSGALRFLRPDGSLVAQEAPDKPSSLQGVEISGSPTYTATQRFLPAADEALYGLGQYNTPYLNYRGKEVLLVQTNIGTVVPFLISTKRYGILWDIYSKTKFVDNAEGASFWSESAPAGIDYYFVLGKDMDGVIAGYRKLTGAAPMIPKAALGLFMSKERYQTQTQLLEVVRRFRQDGFPLDYIVQDWQYWGGNDGTWSGMTWDPARYPDPEGMTAALHQDLHVKLMISIWPSVGNDTALASELDAKGLRFAPLHWISKKARIYDAFSDEARAIYFKHIKQGLLDRGVDALWMDGTEVEVGGACHDAGEVEADIKGLGKNALGDFTRYLNPYSLLTTKGTYEGQRASSNKRVFTLTRSAWAGQQRYGALPWSGDTTASWKTLREQISGGLNIAMAGLPFWTQDTGGFFVNFPDGEKNPAYQELYARWNQFGIFNPIYRIHGTNIEREPYLFRNSAPELYQSLREAVGLRYRLLPYLYSLAWSSSASGYTMMRGLALDYPEQPALRDIDDAYLFGPALLVHPITRPMYHVGRAPAPTIEPEFLRSPEGKAGLEVEYFEGINFEKSAGKLLDPKVEHIWPGPPLAQPPAGLRKLEYFSARWTGSLLPPEDGDYEVELSGDDGYRLWIDGHKLIENWKNGPDRAMSATVTLRKDKAVPIRIEYYQGASARALRLSWRRPAQLKKLAEEKPVLDFSMKTLLPKGGDWYDFWTNQRYTGGSEAKTECPLNRFPLYVRAGSILPMTQEQQFVQEKPAAPLEIRVYPGADASFTLYDDDGESYDYEKGAFAICELRWEENTKTLHIGARKGTFRGMLPEREFRIVFVTEDTKGGIDEDTARVQSVLYRGTALEVQMIKKRSKL